MKLPYTKFYFHGTFATESKAQAAASKWSKSDRTRTFSVKKRQCKTISGGTKTRYTVASTR